MNQYKQLLSPKLKTLINSDCPLSLVEKTSILADFKIDDTVTLYGGKLLESKPLKATLKPQIAKSKNALVLYAGVGAMGLLIQSVKQGMEITCVEQDDNLIAIGKRLLPEAKWVQADPYEFKETQNRYDLVLSTPPNEFRSNGYEYEKSLMDSLKTITKNIIHFIPSTGLMLFVRGNSREYHPFSLPTVAQ